MLVGVGRKGFYFLKERMLVCVLLITCCIVVSRSGLDYLWDAVFEADDDRVDHLLELMDEGLGLTTVQAGSFQVDPKRVESQDGRTALQMCGHVDDDRDPRLIDRNCAAIAKMLIKAGANPAHIDNHGWDALSMASVRGLTDFTEVLAIQKGVDIDRVDNEGRSAIMKAAGHGHIDTVEMLWLYGADARNLDPSGMTLLMQVVNIAMSDHDKYLHLLPRMLAKVINPPERDDPAYPRKQRKKGLSKKFAGPQKLSINQRDARGRTALHYAIIGADRVVVKVLLENDADPSLLDSYGVSPQQMARSLEMVELLKEAAVSRVERQHNHWASEVELELDNDDKDGDEDLSSAWEEENTEL